MMSGGTGGGSFARHGSALVVLADQRASLAAVLVLQEMGLTVDVAGAREAALKWLSRANYSVLICGGGDLAALSAFVIEVRFRAPQTRVILLADPDFTHDGLDELGVEILPAPVDVNMLVERLWPTTA